MTTGRQGFRIDALDRLLGGGLLPGTLTVVAGATGAGKTQLGLRWADAGRAAEGHRGVICDLTSRGDAQNHARYAQELFGWAPSNFPSDAPLDLDSIVASVKKTQHLVVAHDAHKRCGVGAEIAALAMEEAFDYLDAPVERVCGLDVPVPSGPLLTEVYPTAGDLVAAVERSLQRSA